MTTIVLGWDGLDPERVQQFGLTDAFGAHHTAVDTIANGALGKPHTYELWPSIITGLPPGEHGIHADEYIEAGWNSRLLSLAGRYSQLVPEAVRWRVGRLVRDHGAEYAFETPAYYADVGARTLFDDRNGVAVGIPNYRSATDEQLQISMDRGAALSEYLEVDTAADGSTIHRPSVDLATLGMRLESEAGEKLAAAANSLTTGADLVFVWLGYLDTVGHVAPTVADSEGWYRDHYEHAAQWTQFVRDRLGDDDELVCVSDHGLEDGAHTERAFVGGSPPAVEGLEHILDVYDLVESVTPRHGAGGGYERDGSGEAERVQEQLEDLGYI